MRELLDALNLTLDSFGVISEFCVAPDFRENVPHYCFFMELHGELGRSLSSSLLYVGLLTRVDFFLGNKQRNSKQRGLLQTTALASTDRTLLARDDSLYLLDKTVLVTLGVNR